MLYVKELIRLRDSGIPDSTWCQGCGYEHSCGTRGCAVIRKAVSRLEQQSVALARIRKRHVDANGAEKALLGEVLRLFGKEAQS